MAGMNTSFHRVIVAAIVTAGVASAVVAGLPSAAYVSEKEPNQPTPPTAASRSVSIGMKNMGGSGEPDGAIVIHGPDKAK
jgi:hypothetical protein